MYPLDYTDRVEHAVLIYPENWSDLYDLFTYPKMYLENAFHSFIGALPPRWRVGQQVSFIIEPLAENLQSVLFVKESLEPLGIMELGFKDVFGRIEKKDKNESRLAPTAVVQENLTRIRGGKGDGSFICIQFAVNSGVIHVSYVPPKLKVAEDGNKAAKEEFWFNQMIKPFTLSHGGALPSNPASKMELSRSHFDVESEFLTYEQINSFRARIALDMMENPARLNNYLKRSGHFYESSAAVTSAGTQMAFSKAERKVWREKPSSSQPEEVNYLYKADVVGPQIFIENAFADPFAGYAFRDGGGTPPPTTPVCGQVYCTKVKNELTVNRVEQKYYYTFP